MGERKALLIGINEYDFLGELKYAQQDAEAVSEALQQYCGFDRNEITVMSCQARKSRRGLSRYIEHAISSLRNYHDLEMLVFGFWGHGFSPSAGQRYLCGLDTDENDLERTAVSFDLIRSQLAQVQAENTLLLLDCCQNAPTGRGTVETMTEGEEIVLASMARDIQATQQKKQTHIIPTVAVLNACSEGQKAYEWTDREHGVFTAHLLDAFDRGFSSVAPMAAWTAQQVVKTAQEIHHQTQIPYVKIEGCGDIFFQNSDNTVSSKPNPKVSFDPENKISERPEERKVQEDELRTLQEKLLEQERHSRAEQEKLKQQLEEQERQRKQEELKRKLKEKKRIDTAQFLEEPKLKKSEGVTGCHKQLPHRASKQNSLSKSSASFLIDCFAACIPTIIVVLIILAVVVAVLLGVKHTVNSVREEKERKEAKVVKQKMQSERVMEGYRMFSENGDVQATVAIYKQIGEVHGLPYGGYDEYKFLKSLDRQVRQDDDILTIKVDYEYSAYYYNRSLNRVTYLGNGFEGYMWSHNNKKLALRNLKYFEEDYIYVVNSDGKNMRQVGRGKIVRWNSDSELVVKRNKEEHVIRLTSDNR